MSSLEKDVIPLWDISWLFEGFLGINEKKITDKMTSYGFSNLQSKD